MFDYFEGFGVCTVASVHDPGVVVGCVAGLRLRLDEDEALVEEHLRDFGLGH